MSAFPLLTLRDVCAKITDGTHHSPKSHPSGDFKYITAKNIKSWGLDLSDLTYIDAATHRGGVSGGNGSEPRQITRNGFTHRRSCLNRRQRTASHTVTAATCRAL